MRLASPFRPVCFHALVLSLLISVGTTSPILAQDASTPSPGSETKSGTSSETTSQLPPADLPTMNPQGYVFELDSVYEGTFSEIPDEAPVYGMQVPEIDAEKARATAENFGIDGEVSDDGSGTFNAEGTAGSLFITQGMMQFISSQAVPGGELPTDEEAIAFAREWLRQVRMLPPNVGDGKVVTRIDEPPRIIVSFQPVKPSPLLSASPNISVTLGPEGAVLESSYRWAEISEGDLYQLRGAEAAWNEVEGQRAYLETLLTSDEYQPGSIISGTATYTDVSIAYTSSGIPGEQQFLQPVYVFTGQITPEGSKESYPITAYVPALINSQQPVG